LPFCFQNGRYCESSQGKPSQTDSYLYFVYWGSDFTNCQNREARSKVSAIPMMRMHVPRGVRPLGRLAVIRIA